VCGVVAHIPGIVSVIGGLVAPVRRAVAVNGRFIPADRSPADGACLARLIGCGHGPILNEPW
jgi:hypothetical protein